MEQAIEPRLELASALANWNQLVAQLGEPPRQRQPQLRSRFGSPEPEAA